MNGRFLNPVYSCAGIEYQLTEKENLVYSDGRIRAAVKMDALSKDRIKVSSEWKNLADKTVELQPELRLETDFVCEHYTIPGVSVNGNHWGKGKEPKDLSCNGEPWVFDYRRTSIPACTISENEEKYLALMASNESEASLKTSCSMIPQSSGRMVHRLLYPCMERPFTYSTRDGYREAHEDTIRLLPGQTFTAEAFILSGKPVRKNYAAAAVEDAALELLNPTFDPAYTPEEVSDLCLEFAKGLILEVNGRKLFSIGQSLDEKKEFRNNRGFEFGWCGQNGMYARLFLKRGLERKDQELIDIAVSNLDAWSKDTVGKTGLIHTHYDWMLDGKNTEDTCNLGFAILELTEAWILAKEYGKDFPAWIEAAKSCADFLVEHYSEEYGFGKAWDVEIGECIDPQGTIGAYVIPGLAELWKQTKEERYLTCAKIACSFYCKRDLEQFCCTAGALDTYCIDKESSGPLLAGCLALYEIDHSEVWLEYAKLAGWYFSSWMFHHDTIPEADSDFAEYGYRTLGGTSVSAQHHHIDPWGALVVPQLLQLWKLTGDIHWKKRADLMWANAIQNIAPFEGKTIHGILRRAGAQNEGYHHCCWGDKKAPGFINEWLVAWPQAFCWNTADRMTEKEYQ